MAESNSPWDQLHKGMLAEQLAAVGRVARELELSGEPLRADVAFFWPDGGLDRSRLARLGLLGRMLEEGTCVFEPHSGHPDEEAIRSAARKAQYLWLLCRDQHEPGPGRVWVLSSTRPTTLLELFGCAPGGGRWPQGVYLSSQGSGLAVVVLGELPEVRATLALRLLGRGRILARAWDQLQALPEDAPERGLLVILARSARALSDAGRAGEVEIGRDEAEVLMDAQRWFEEEKRRSELAGRRVELLRSAQELVDAATFERLCAIEDVEELERVVRTDAQRWFEEEKRQSEQNGVQVGRRAELLRVATTVLGEEVGRRLESIEDLDELEREVLARLRPAGDDA